MMAAVAYLSLAVVLGRAQPRVITKAYLLSIAMLMTLLVGTSRVYLGVHYPSDVAAGWAVGAAWALIASSGAKWLQGHGKVEGPGARVIPAAAW